MREQDFKGYGRNSVFIPNGSCLIKTLVIDRGPRKHFVQCSNHWIFRWRTQCYLRSNFCPWHKSLVTIVVKLGQKRQHS